MTWKNEPSKKLVVTTLRKKSKKTHAPQLIVNWRQILIVPLRNLRWLSTKYFEVKYFLVVLTH